MNNKQDWHLSDKYSWSQDGFNELVSIISDNESDKVLKSLLQFITYLLDTNVIGDKLGEYISQGCQKLFTFSFRNRQKRKHVQSWYDKECRFNRSLAIRPGNVSILGLKESNRILYVTNTEPVSKEKMR